MSPLNTGNTIGNHANHRVGFATTDTNWIRIMNHLLTLSLSSDLYCIVDILFWLHLNLSILIYYHDNMADINDLADSFTGLTVDPYADLPRVPYMGVEGVVSTTPYTIPWYYFNEYDSILSVRWDRNDPNFDQYYLPWLQTDAPYFLMNKHIIWPTDQYHIMSLEGDLDKPCLSINYPYDTCSVDYSLSYAYFTRANVSLVVYIGERVCLIGVQVRPVEQNDELDYRLGYIDEEPLD